MANQEAMKKAIQDLRALLSTLDRQVTDCQVTDGKTNSTACKAAMDAINTTLQASSNFSTLS